MANKSLGDIEPRTLVLSLVGALVILALLGYTYLLAPQIQELRMLDAQVTDAPPHQANEQAKQQLATRIEHLESEIDALNQSIYGDASSKHGRETVSFVISRLDTLSVARNVSLLSVKPGNEGKMLGYREYPFEIEVEGEFRNLYGWLDAAEKNLRPMVVKQFTLSPVARQDRLRMQLRVVSYRPPPGIRR